MPYTYAYELKISRTHGCGGSILDRTGLEPVTSFVQESSWCFPYLITVSREYWTSGVICSSISKLKRKEKNEAVSL